MMHLPASGITFPIDVPMFVAAHGPKGFAVAERLNVGVVTNPTHGENPVPVAGDVNLLHYGTILDDDEPIEAPRVVDAAAPGAGLALHMGEYGPLAGMEEAKGYAAAIAQVDERRRHLEIFRGHLMAPSELDRQFLTPEVIRRGTTTAKRAEVAQELRRLEDAGATAILYQPGGPDIERELQAFWEAAQMRHDVEVDARSTPS
jgi:5,10-methylenetetrahydromethanopterin reductase